MEVGAEPEPGIMQLPELPVRVSLGERKLLAHMEGRKSLQLEFPGREREREKKHFSRAHR